MFDFIASMKIEPNAIVWRIFLELAEFMEMSGCQNEQLLRMRMRGILAVK